MLVQRKINLPKTVLWLEECHQLMLLLSFHWNQATTLDITYNRTAHLIDVPCHLKAGVICLCAVNRQVDDTETVLW